MYIPLPIINIILKYMGAYKINLTKRPYIKTLKLLSKTIVNHGISDTFIYIKEITALTNAYRYTNIWIFRFFT